MAVHRRSHRQAKLAHPFALRLQASRVPPLVWARGARGARRPELGPGVSRGHQLGSGLGPKGRDSCASWCKATSAYTYTSVHTLSTNVPFASPTVHSTPRSPSRGSTTHASFRLGWLWLGLPELELWMAMETHQGGSLVVRCNRSCRNELAYCIA